ncbi:hypothetical protein E2C06_21990 [Dankookia rubra]|uniref:Uncharacterized protein n=1 Tax=Dankookia rubra TaxID=1442381 RepID=A0A4R5QBE3_9PROT|nr:hypothetical protein E2C06_21990 [Dankookia rubra]
MTLQICGTGLGGSMPNPVENTRQFTWDNWLSNRIFHCHGDIVDHCCRAWNRLVEQPWTIMSTGLRDGTQGF